MLVHNFTLKGIAQPKLCCSSPFGSSQRTYDADSGEPQSCAVLPTLVSFHLPAVMCSNSIVCTALPSAPHGMTETFQLLAPYISSEHRHDNGHYCTSMTSLHSYHQHAAGEGLHCRPRGLGAALGGQQDTFAAPAVGVFEGQRAAAAGSRPCRQALYAGLCMPCDRVLAGSTSVGISLLLLIRSAPQVHVMPVIV